MYDSAIIGDEIPGARKKLFRLLEKNNPDKLVEVGVGTGRNIPFYPNIREIVGVDMSKNMLNIAHRKKDYSRKSNLTLQIANAHNLPFETNYFDNGVLTYALSGIPDSNATLSELERVVRPNGIIGILDFSSIGPWIIGGVSGVNLQKLCNGRDNSNIVYEDHMVLSYDFFNSNHISMYLLEVLE